jgi:hypothetical protein
LKATRFFLGEIRRVKYLLALLAALVAADGLVSYFAVTAGLAEESNPFLRPLINNVSFLTIKMVGGILSALLLWYIYKRQPKLGLASIVFFVGLYTGILWWNLGVLFFVLA